MWPSTLVTLCNKFGQNSCLLVVSLPLEALHISAFSNLAATQQLGAIYHTVKSLPRYVVNIDIIIIILLLKNPRRCDM